MNSQSVFAFGLYDDLILVTVSFIGNSSGGFVVVLVLRRESGDGGGRGGV